MENPEIIRYMQHLNGYLQHQHQQMQQMNMVIQQLVRQVHQLHEKISQPQVIRNEYKFDLLKVERLEGTLNIGIRPDGKGADSSIEEFAVGQSMEVPSLMEKQYPLLYQKIQQQVRNYLDHDAYQALQALEKQYMHPLDDPYRKFIVEDVKKQIDKRISYYLNQIRSEGMPQEEAEKFQQPVFVKIKEDVDKTFETFIKNLPREESGGLYGI